MKSNAIRMQTALDFVIANPGVAMRAVIQHVLETTFDADKREKAKTNDALSSKLYKQSAAVVDRIIKDRYVCVRFDKSLHPWDPKRKAYAEALERARNAALDPAERATLTQLTCKAWRAAGDENRARTIFLLDSSHDEALS